MSSETMKTSIKLLTRYGSYQTTSSNLVVDQLTQCGTHQFNTYVELNSFNT